MRLAVAGKGGSGKTTIAATLARRQAARGRPVVAIDADSNPNLGAALGADGHLGADALPHGLVSRRPDGPRLTQPLADVLAAHGRPAPDGITLVTMGAPAQADTGCLCSAHATVGALLADLGARPEVLTIIDLEGTPEHLSRGTARHADVLVLVAEPYFRSLESVRRLARLGRDLGLEDIRVVANKVRSPLDEHTITALCDDAGLPVLGSVPWSTDVLDADGAGRPLVDAFPAGPAVTAVDGVARALGLDDVAHQGRTA